VTLYAFVTVCVLSVYCTGKSNSALYNCHDQLLLSAIISRLILVVWPFLNLNID